MSNPHRAAVLNLYKTLLFLGRDWPQGHGLFKKRLHKVFTKNANETDPKKIEDLIKHGNYVVKEIEALYMLKKYRAMKRSEQTTPRKSKFGGCLLTDDFTFDCDKLMNIRNFRQRRNM